MASGKGRQPEQPEVLAVADAHRARSGLCIDQDRKKNFSSRLLGLHAWLDRLEPSP